MNIELPNRQSLGKRVLYVTLSSTITVLFFVAVAIVWRLYFNNPPIVAVSLSEPPAAGVCPGAEYPAHSQIAITDPTLLYYYFSVLGADGFHNYDNTQISNPPRLHPKPATFEQVLPWVVPELPPGVYTRVLSFRGTDGHEKSVFLEWKFTIKEGCKR